MAETRIPNRGGVKPGKVQCNWRIDERALNYAKVAAPELGFSSVPSMVSYILLRALTNEQARRAVFGGR